MSRFAGFCSKSEKVLNTVTTFNETKVSEIEIIPVKPKGGLIGFASFVLDEKYYISSVAIFTRPDGSGYRLIYPSKKVGEKNLNIFHPINAEAGKAIEEAVTRKVNEIFSEIFNENYENKISN